MKIYFLSSQPCVLTLNGAYFGVTDLFERSADVCLNDNLYAEFLPENALPIRFFITEKLRFQPPDGCDVYLLPDAIAIYAHDFPPTDSTLRVVKQEKVDDCLVTLFFQGRLYLSVQTEKNFFNATLPPSFAHSDLHFHCGLLLLSTPNELAVFTKDGKRLLQEKILSFSVENDELSARLPLSDRLGRYADCRWRLSETDCVQTAFLLQEKQSAETENPVSDGLLAYAFFESVLIGANFADMLSDELRADADKIRAFLGDFVGVTLTDKPTRCGLVRRKENRLFSVDYFEIAAKDGKITEITT